MSFLRLDKVSKSFRHSQGVTEVLKDVSLDISEGEFVAILGYSGSGKTTLLNLVAGLSLPDEGSVTLEGKTITGPGADRGVVFQNYSLLPWLSVRQNIALAVDSAFPKLNAAQRKAQVDEYIALVKLSHAADKLPRELSGGMRQRVSLARGLSLKPRILLLDEPLGALDALTRSTLQEELVSIWEKQRTTVLLITNDVDEALLTADRIIPLSMGPGATLTDSIPVSLTRPRDRKALNHDPEFKRLRALVTRRLLSFREGKRETISARVTLPDLLPEDLSRGKPFLPFGRQPRRRPAADTRTTITIAT
jgi:nitrate/nitrite transport system ATP-binding protein